MKSCYLLLWVILAANLKSELEAYIAESYPEHQLRTVEELEGAVVRVSLWDKSQGRTLKVRLKAIESKSGKGVRFELKRSCGHVIEDILQSTKKSI